MKKLFFVFVALLGMTTVTMAQNYDNNRKKAMYDASGKFTVVDNKYAVMYYPVTYYDYYAVTGKKVNGRKGINDVMPMQQNDRVRFAQDASALNKKVSFHVASSSELQQALQKKKNIQSESGPYNTSTKGFYLAMDYQSYQAMQALRNQHNKVNNIKTKPGGKLIGTSDKEGDIFNIQ